MAFVSPEDIIKSVSIDEGMHVADFGAGSGAYVLAAAKRVGHSGRVYAIDVNKELLEKVKRDAIQNSSLNVEIIWGDVEVLAGSKLAASSVDRVILSNILFQVKDKDAVVKEVARILKPNGMALVVDWSGSYGGLGPKESQVISSRETRKLFLNNSFEEVKKIGAGDYHFAIIFRRL